MTRRVDVASLLQGLEDEYGSNYLDVDGWLQWGAAWVDSTVDWLSDEHIPPAATAPSVPAGGDTALIRKYVRQVDQLSDAFRKRQRRVRPSPSTTTSSTSEDEKDDETRVLTSWPEQVPHVASIPDDMLTLRTCREHVPTEFFAPVSLFSVFSSEPLQNFDQNVGDGESKEESDVSRMSDLVECALIRQVSLRRSAFFGALTSLQELSRESHETQQQVAAARQVLREARQKAAEPLELLALKKRERRASQVLQLTRKVREICVLRNKAKAALGSDDVETCAAAIQLAWQIRSEDARLSGVQCLNSVVEELSECRQMLRERLMRRMLRVLLPPEEIHRDVEESSCQAAAPVLRQLLLLREHECVADSLHAGMSEHYHELLKTRLTDTVTELDGLVDSRHGIKSRVQALRSEHFQRLLGRLFAPLLVSWRRLDDGWSAVLSQVESADRAEALMAHFCAARNGEVDSAHVRLATVLKWHTCDNLSLRQATALQHSVSSFARQSELLCARPVLPLRAACTRVLERFAQHAHKDALTHIDSVMSLERWRRTQVPRHMQAMLDAALLTDGRTGSRHTDEALVAQVTVRTSDFFGQSQDTQITEVTQGSEAVGALSFQVASAALVLLQRLQTLVATCQALSLPGSVQAAALIRRFDLRCKQQVLQAGAIRTAQLSSITAPHLCIASQSIGFVRWLLPLLHEALDTRSDASRALQLSELRHIGDELLAHRAQLRRKLASILRGVCDSAVARVDSVTTEGSTDGSGSVTGISAVSGSASGTVSVSGDSVSDHSDHVEPAAALVDLMRLTGTTSLACAPLGHVLHWDMCTV
ncbi:MAG: hypothetical protein MHM6MM_004618 [Cercozoa sp. M6MM]